MADSDYADKKAYLKRLSDLNSLTSDNSIYKELLQKTNLSDLQSFLAKLNVREV